MTRTLIMFAAGTIAGVMLLAGVFYARKTSDTVEAEYGAMAAMIGGAICLVPTVLAVALKMWSKDKSATEQLMAVTLGMLLRMGVVMGLGLAVFLNVPQIRETRERELVFWSAILICYLGTLAWETILTARGKKAEPAIGVPANVGPAAGRVGE